MIVYAVIARARDAAALTECTSPDVSGNIAQVTVALLEHLRDHPGMMMDGERKTFAQRNTPENDFLGHFLESCATMVGDDAGIEEYYFHLYFLGGVLYCCLGDDPHPTDHKVNFAFLDHVSKEFLKAFRMGRIDRANAYGLDKQFKPNLRSAIHYHNVNHDTIGQEQRTQKLLAQVEDVRQVLGRNINIMLENHESLDRLAVKSDSMLADAAIFKRKSRAMRARQQRKYYFMMMIIGSFVVGLVYLAVIGICGVGMEHCRAPSSSSSSGNNGDGNGGGGDGGNR